MARRSLSGSRQSLVRPGYDTLIAGDPIRIGGHSLMHAPTLKLMALRWSGQPGSPQVDGLGLSSSGSRSVVDPLRYRYRDASPRRPRLLFPFNSDHRFAIPISYRGPRHCDRVVTLVEYGLDFAVLIATLRTPTVRRVRRLRLRLPYRQTD